tara:strand:- start:1045 stop:1272 length:228 start_codon:yes stop_codon:yes gene_type:complete
MKLKNIPEDIKTKSIKEAQDEIEGIIQGLENNDVNTHNSVEQYKRMMQLNNHIHEEFKKKAKEINKTSFKKKSKK